MNRIIRENIEERITRGLEQLRTEGSISFEELPEIHLEIPREKQHGDVSTNVAMQLARQARMSPQRIGEMLVERLNSEPFLEEGFHQEAKLAGQGFINFSLDAAAFSTVLSEILFENERFGRAPEATGTRVLIEFVSANPTGPLTLAHGRQAAVGDVLASIMEWAGHEVTREYYLNDRGKQIALLGRSVYARYMEQGGGQSDFPEDGYQGGYIRDLAVKIREEAGERFEKEFDLEAFSELCSRMILDEILKDLENFGVSFDVIFSEKEFARAGKVETCLNEMKKMGLTFEKEGALWFRSSHFGDDKDRVLVKSDGEMTYISPDIAYHLDKYERGFSRLVNLWGPDHHGYIPRIRAAMEALDMDPEAFLVLIVQLCTLYEEGEKKSMSTRKGEFVTLREIMDEVGKDAARYFFVMRRTDSHLDFDLELARQQTPDNPVFYVQYAHARIHSIFKKYVEKGGNPSAVGAGDACLERLVEEEEKGLIRLLGLFPDLLEGCARSAETNRLTSYLEEIAQTFHKYYEKHRVVGQDEALTRARLSLCKGVGIVLCNGLTVLGISAPETM